MKGCFDSFKSRIQEIDIKLLHSASTEGVTDSGYSLSISRLLS
ncbi:MAG: hypothetical protein P8X74_05665 [Reinekea sp.]